MRKLLVLQLRFLIPLLVFILFMASISFAIINHVQNHKEEKIQMLEENLKLRMYGLQNELNDIYALKLNDLIKRRISEFCLDPQINVLVLIDDKDEIVYSNFGEYIGKSYGKLKEIEISKAQQIIHKNNGHLLFKEEHQFVAYMNINMDVYDGEIRKAKQGFIYFQYDFHKLLDQAMQSAYYDAISYLMSGIAFALILSFILFRLITKPVNEITLKMNEFAKGNLSARVKIDNSNEIGILANGFNRMADEIEKKSFSLQLLQFIVEHSSDAFYIIREDASFEFVNGSASRDLGYTKEEFSKFRLYDIDRNFTPEMWEKNWELLKSIKEKTIETTQTTKSGDRLPVEIAISYAMFNGVEYHLAVVRNISDRKQAENETLIAKHKAEENEIKYRLLYENNPMPMSIFDIDTLAFLSVNNAFVDKYGYTEEEFLNMTILGIRPESEYDKVKQAIHPDAGIANVGIFTHKKKNGELIQVEIIRHGLIFNDKKAKLVLVNDVTEKIKAEQELLQMNAELIKATQKAEESEKLKTAFLQNMSHEIRTPLNGIIGFSNLLQDRDITMEEIFDYTSIIKQSGTRLLEIVNNVLDISKIETGQIIVTNSDFTVNTILANAYSFFSPIAHNKNIELHYVNYPEIITINSDEAKINQILTNLINNAIKFTHQGSVSFGFELKDNDLVFFVKDTGTGISQNDYVKIFDRFTQIDLKITRGYEGAGLGLAISKGLVELLGGKIWLDSKIDVGSTFYFSIPYKTSQNTEIKTNGTNEMISKPKKGTILIVEDDLTSSMYLNQVLLQAGYNVFIEQNGKDAIELIESNDFINLVLMDIRMPVMNGIEATKYIKSIKPNLPIIAQTAYAFSEEKEMILSIGCNDYISKPVAADKLLKLIDKHIVKIPIPNK